MINASRSLARQANSYLSQDEATDVRRGLVLRQIAYVNALRCQLRKQTLNTDALGMLTLGEAGATLARSNIANGILDGTGAQINKARENGWLDSIQQVALESLLVDITNAQGGMERLKNTPLPNQYRFFPTLFTQLFCLLLPVGLVETLGVATPLGSSVAGLMFLAVLAIGNDLVDPFSNTVHDVPLSAMCRTIEIDLLQSIGDLAPDPATPDRHGVLW